MAQKTMRPDWGRRTKSGFTLVPLAGGLVSHNIEVTALSYVPDGLTVEVEGRDNTPRSMGA
jgi:hypothetical protein